MQYHRMAIEREAPEQLGYDRIKYNLSESSYTDQLLDTNKLNLHKLVLHYGDHLGNPQLRQLLATDYGVDANDVLITAGAASALFMVATALLTPKDTILVMTPNYATNIETPRSIGCKVVNLPVKIEDNFRLNIDLLRHLVELHRPKLISLTTPHNPTGTMLSAGDLYVVAELAKKYKCYVLVDETYRDLALITLPPLAATLSNNIVSVSSMSKTYGLPGIRIGWLVGKDKALMNQLLAAKEQIFICNSVIDEEIALQVLQQKNTLLPNIIADVKTKLGIVTNWLKTQPLLDYVLPDGGVACFPRINLSINTKYFYKQLLIQYGTYVGRGGWFDMPDNYFRIGYAWMPNNTDLQQGLNNVSQLLDEIVNGKG